MDGAAVTKGGIEQSYLTILPFWYIASLRETDSGLNIVVPSCTSKSSSENSGSQTKISTDFDASVPHTHYGPIIFLPMSGQEYRCLQIYPGVSKPANYKVRCWPEHLYYVNSTHVLSVVHIVLLARTGPIVGHSDTQRADVGGNHFVSLCWRAKIYAIPTKLACCPQVAIAEYAGAYAVVN